jgi:hypothetical protein
MLLIYYPLKITFPRASLRGDVIDKARPAAPAITATHDRRICRHYEYNSARLFGTVFSYWNKHNLLKKLLVVKWIMVIFSK